MGDRDEHVVFYPGPNGSPAFRRVPSRDEGVRFVEHLRNVEAVADVTLHRLSEVPLSFRAYYRVEVGAGAAAADAEAPVEAAAAPAAAPATAPVGQAPAVTAADPAEEVPAPRAESNGKRGLAFFAS